MDKLAEVQLCISKAINCRSMSNKHLQSLLGKLVHVGKCVCLVHIFISQLLDALHGMYRKFINSEMRLENLWFQELLPDRNHVSRILTPAPSKVILLDASPIEEIVFSEGCT